MFDIGFTELLLCLIVALVVIGPEQLPGTVRTVALWIGRLKRSLTETRAEIERQIGADDIRRQLHNEDIMRNLEETRLQLEASIRQHTELVEQDVTQQPSATDYGPPEELPDHAHGSDHPAQNQAAGNPQQPAKPLATAPAPASNPPAAVTTNQTAQNNSPSQAPAPAPVADTPAPVTDTKASSAQQAV